MAPTADVGVTATLGAAARAIATHKGLMDDPFAEPLVVAAGVENVVRMISDERFAADDGDAAAMNGLMDALAAHTRFVDEFLADAGRAGISQVVILASGLDTRPYRMWWPRGTTIFEVDRPEVLDFKSEALRGLGAQLAANRCAVGVDFRQDWVSALHRIGFDAGQPTAWVAEQLLVGYLQPDVQNQLLHDVTSVSTIGSRFAADHMPIWSPLQLEAERAFVDGCRQNGLDIDLASLTHPGEYHYVPEYLAGRGWATVERDIASLRSGMGLANQRRGGPRDTAFVPEYLTATRV